MLFTSFHKSKHLSYESIYFLKNYAHISYLVEQVKKGNKMAFRSLYELHSKQMLNTSMRIVNNRQMAQDVLQDSFVKAYSKIDSLKDPSTFSSWLKRIVINQSLENLRLKKHVFEELKEDKVLDEQEEHWSNSFSSQQIEAAIMELPDKCRIILSMYSFEGLTHKEIGRHLVVSESTSKSQYRYGLKLLRTALSKKRAYEL